MFDRNLSDAVTAVVAAGPQPAGSSPVVGVPIGTQGYEGVRVLAVLGAVAAGCRLAVRLQGGALADGSDAVDLVGCLCVVDVVAPLAAGKLVSLDVVGPGRRYVRAVLTRTGADAAVTCVLAELHGHRRPPAPAGDVIAAAVRAAV